MAGKRVLSGESVLNTDIKFELEKTEKSTLYLVVSRFQNNAYVHIRKYYNDHPSRFGVTFKTHDWYELVEYMETESTHPKSFEKCDVKKLKGGSLVLSSLVSDMDLYLRVEPISVLLKR